MNKFSADYRHQVLLDASEGDEKAFAKLFYEYSPIYWHSPGNFRTIHWKPKKFYKTFS